MVVSGLFCADVPLRTIVNYGWLWWRLVQWLRCRRGTSKCRLQRLGHQAGLIGPDHSGWYRYHHRFYIRWHSRLSRCRRTKLSAGGSFRCCCTAVWTTMMSACCCCCCRCCRCYGQPLWLCWTELSAASPAHLQRTNSFVPSSIS